VNAASNVKLCRIAKALAIAADFPLRFLRDNAKALHMSEEDQENLTREERLAAKLRENLRKRKSQLRELNNGDTSSQN
jgi:hypothetical protein